MGEVTLGKSVRAAKRAVKPRVDKPAGAAIVAAPVIDPVVTETATVALAPVVAEAAAKVVKAPAAKSVARPAAKSRVSAPAPVPQPEQKAPARAAPEPSVPESAAPSAAPAPAVAAPPAAAPADSPKEDTMATVINETADKAKSNATFSADAVKSMTSEAQDRANEAMQKGMKFVEEMNSFAKGNVEAMVEASKIAAKGAEDMAKYTTDYARGSVEKANDRARRIAAVKSPTELLQIQSELARETMDSVAQETSKFAEGYLKLLGQIAQPFQNRFAVAAEKMKASA
jgi:hypothetical protein